jgi:uncharacterized membrane protein
VRGTRLRRPARRRRIQGITLFVVGVALLVLGVVVPFRVAEIPLVSVLGFVVMFFGALIALTSLRHHGDGEGGGVVGSAHGGGKGQARKSSFTQRMEERFRQRFEDH